MRVYLPELDENSEVVVQLANGFSLRSGVYEPDNPQSHYSGEYVRLCDSEGAEVLYWDQEEWANDPSLVMGAIINSASTANSEEEV